jgi:hypothetical protein
VNEDNGVPFCMNTATVQGSQPFPQGFITTAHYQQTDSYTQITGFFDRSKYNLSESDGGGQYDSHANHKPVGSSCQNFPFFVSMIEPSNNRFCIRCCQNTEDCKTGISQYGCARVVTPGNYEENNAFDAVPPSDANESGGDGGDASGSAGPSASSSGATPSNSAAPSDGADAGSSDGSSDDTGSSDGSGDDAGSSDDSGAGTDDETDDHSDQGGDEHHLNTSYNSVLDDLDASGAGTNGTDSSGSSNGSDIKSVDDEAKYIQSQLQSPQADLNSLKTQFTSFTSNLATQFPEAADKIKQLESITSSYQTADQWKHLATILQQKAPESASGN